MEGLAKSTLSHHNPTKKAPLKCEEIFEQGYSVHYVHGVNNESDSRILGKFPVVYWLSHIQYDCCIKCIAVQLKQRKIWGICSPFFCFACFHIHSLPFEWLAMAEAAAVTAVAAALCVYMRTIYVGPKNNKMLYFIVEWLQWGLQTIYIDRIIWIEHTDIYILLCAVIHVYYKEIIYGLYSVADTLS